ncbi:unnamed protein product, partial [marine sediment metagenome]
TSRKEPYIGKHWTKHLARAYRYFYLMAGYYSKYNFFDWLKEGIKNDNNKFYLD